MVHLFPYKCRLVTVSLYINRDARCSYQLASLILFSGGFTVYHYFLYAIDYFWDEETGIPSGIKEVSTDHFDIERDLLDIEGAIIQFIRVLARFDFGFMVRIDSNDVVAILDLIDII